MTHPESANKTRRPWLELSAQLLLCAGLCLLLIGLYHHFYQRSPEHIGLQAAREAAAQIESARLQQQDAAVAQALADERLRQAVLTLSASRTALAEFILSQGQLPPSFEALGLDYLQLERWLESAEIGANGQLRFQLKPNLHPGGMLLLTPEIGPDGFSILGWDCQSPDLPRIGIVIPGCDYRAPAATR